MTVSAAVKVMPCPPARVDSRNTKLSLSPACHRIEDLSQETQQEKILQIIHLLQACQIPDCSPTEARIEYSPAQSTGMVARSNRFINLQVSIVGVPNAMI